MRAEERQITKSNAKQAWEAIKPFLPTIARWYIKTFPHTKLSKVIQVIFELMVKNDQELNDFRERS